MKEKVTLNKREQERLMILNKVEKGIMTGIEAAEVMELSLRHARRLLAAYRKEGSAALAHGNRGRKPHNALDDAVKRRIVELAQSTYAGCNTQHFTELLAEREELSVSRSSVRQVLLEVGIRSPRKRRAPKHRSRRERYPQEGMLLQTDGSPHDWLQGRGPWLSLVGAIDDATGKVPYALFREQEDAQGYFLLLRQIVSDYGIPLALYHDRHGIFERSKNVPDSVEEQLEGKRATTQFGRLMEELCIASISALSPQAKGRIERLWGTFQDRLVSELRLAGATTVNEANEVLKAFLPRYNRRFAVPALQPGSAYRKPEDGFNPGTVFCFKYQRIVSSDNVVRFAGQRLQILPSNGRLSYTHARVEVHERLDGSLAVYYQGHCLLTTPAPAEAPVIRARKSSAATLLVDHNQKPAILTEIQKRTADPKLLHALKPASDHPWRTWVYRAHK